MTAIGCGNGGGVVVLSAGHECVGGTFRSGIVSSAYDVLGISGVRGLREVGGVCEMCMCFGSDRCRR